MPEMVVTFQTTPSTWLHALRPPTPEPYQRVVGVQTDFGPVTARFPVTTPITTHRFVLPGYVPNRLHRFFDHYIAGHDPEHPDSPERQHPRPPLRYNCHLFALAMRGYNIANVTWPLLDLGTATRDFDTLREPPETGRHGVVRNAKTRYITHSFISIGKELNAGAEAPPMTLQVVDNNSNLALLPYNMVPNLFQGSEPGEYELAA